MKIQAQATGRLIANFAWQHLKAATLFRDHVVEIEARNSGLPFAAFFEEIRSYASGAIMSATASLEALINELFIAPNCGLRSMFSDFETEFWGPRGVERKPILEKYQLALEMRGNPRIDERASSYHDGCLLIELRNALVHYKPTWDPDRKRKAELVELLGGRYVLSPFLEEGADFVTMKSMSAGCAIWVVQSALAFMREFDSRMHLDDNKMSGFWKLEA